MNLNQLYELQLHELKILTVNRKINNTKSDNLQNRLKEEYKDLKNQYLFLSDKLKNQKKVIENARKEIMQLEANKKHYEDLKYTPEINSPKKLKLVEKQIAEVEKSIKQEYRKIENESNRAKKDKIEIISVKKRLAFIKNKFDRVGNETKEELEKLYKEQKSIGMQIINIKNNLSEDELSEYSKLKNRFADPISLVKSRKCTGCSVAIPSMDYEAVRAGEVLKCENCNRLLLYKKDI